MLRLAAVSSTMLQRAILACNGSQPMLGSALGADRKGKLSLVLYAAAIPLAFLAPWIAIVLYVAVAAIWLVPDRRIERGVGRGG